MSVRPTTVVTANVLWTLSDLSAREALALLLGHDPDLVALQEWGFSRRHLLRETEPDYTWVAPVLGGCPIGFRSDRYALVASRQRVLSGPRRADPDAAGRRAWLRPRIATLVVVRDLLGDGAQTCVIDVHLTPGVQQGGHYRQDRPVVVARHRQEVRRLARVVATQQARGLTVSVAGDFNVEGLCLAGLTSAWEGRQDQPGTLGARHVDDVHGPAPAVEVILVTTDSDHRGVVARRP